MSATNYGATRKEPLGRCVESYEYPPAVVDGRPVSLRKRRHEPKAFTWEHSRTGWESREPGLPRGVVPGLYHADELVPGVLSENPTVWICEGEKDVDRLRSLGLLATSTPHGALSGKKTWDPSWTPALRKFDRAVVLEDADPVGIDHAVKVARALHGTIPDVRVLRLPGLPEHGDVSDFLNAEVADVTVQARPLEERARHLRGRLEELAEAAPKWTPRVEAEVLSTAQLIELRLPDVSWRIEKLLPDAGLAALSGWSGVWKSWLLHHVAVVLASGGRFLDAYKCERGRVLFLQAEENLSEHRRKLTWTMEGTGLSEEARRALDVHHRVGPITLSDKSDLAGLVAAIRDLKPDVVIVDNLRETFAGEEKDSLWARYVKQMFNEIQAVHPCSVVVVHHHRKLSSDASQNDPGQRMRGTSALRAILDQHWAVERCRDGSATFAHEKSRQGREEPPFSFRFEAGEGRATFVNLGPAPGARAGRADENLGRVLDALRKLGAHGGARSEDIADEVGLSLSTTKAYLARLEAVGKARRTGSGRATRWWPVGEATEPAEGVAP